MSSLDRDPDNDNERRRSPAPPTSSSYTSTSNAPAPLRSRRRIGFDSLDEAIEKNAAPPKSKDLRQPPSLFKSRIGLGMVSSISKGMDSMSKDVSKDTSTRGNDKSTVHSKADSPATTNDKVILQDTRILDEDAAVPVTKNDRYDYLCSTRVVMAALKSNLRNSKTLYHLDTSYSPPKTGPSSRSNGLPIEACIKAAKDAGVDVLRVSRAQLSTLVKHEVHEVTLL
jgi:hypothetical protein